MAFTPCTQSSSCIKISTQGNALVAEPVIAGNPSTDTWPYRNCRAGSKNALHCSEEGMWAEPTFCTDYAEYEIEAESGALELSDINASDFVDIGDRLRIDSRDADTQFCNTSCYPVVAIIDIQWPWVNYAGASGVAFDVYGQASLPCATGSEFLKGSVNTTSLFNPSGPAASNGTALSGGSRRFFCRLCPCLLYTSPSPRDRQKSRMPSSA